ncbi:hypothetical protein GW17_00060645 [Ensete ventricosum]|nr:hypothetical protein GW17_00060645 [Ensete ventricosum]
MHPLVFPNCGIRAKVFVRKIGFKLRVMRLNRVESFNAFTAITARRRGWSWLAARGSRLQPRPPCKGAAGHYQPPLQGRPVATRPPARGMPATCKGRPPRGRGRLPTVHPQGAVAPWQGDCRP